MKRTCTFLCLLLLPALSVAEIYLELGLENGGKTLASTSSEDLNIAGGVKVAIGMQRYIGGFEDVGLLFSVGYLFDEIDASNGSAEFDATVFEFIYFRNFGPHQVGTGASYHLHPRYEDDLDGFARTKLDFDDALGIILRYSYAVTEGFNAGLRYTIMDYEADGSSLDADSIGLFLSGAF